jgi:5-histidylcysteine sulfoxide synthase/putative 4-mercaptohistidine N1-methyltranferase
MASYTDSDSDEDNDNDESTTTTRDTVKDGVLSQEETWRVNVGRADNNEWLTGPRDPDEWFTGKQPKICPGVDGKEIIRSLPLPRLDAVTREAAMEYFDNSWTLYETLFAGLNGEEYLYRPPPHGLRHPQIFYYGHTACLYINKLRVSGVLNKPCNAYFESIFEVGVDEMLWDDMEKNEMLWPTARDVHEYRKQVYEVVKEAIMTHPSLDDSNGPVTVDQSHPMWALFMGYEHERIHLETSSVLFREAPKHLVQAPKNWPPLHPSALNKTPSSNPVEGVDYPQNKMISVKKDNVDLGKPANFPSYGWDNEYGERTVEVPDFAASEHMITNGEYYQFVKEGGYRSQEYWCDDGWAWRAHRNLKWPFFWQQVGPAGSHEYNLRTIFDIVPMQWDWPVDCTYYEAKAFCDWKTKKDGSPRSNPYRVLTEAEHHVIRHKDNNLESVRKDVSADKVMVTSGEDFPAGSHGANLNLAFSSQNPVDQFAPSHTGHRDTTGNAWEWTEDHFNPLKGFEVHHVYDDFSSPCFDGKHSMIVGGSFVSTGDEASVFARFHFRPHFQQHSGFRLVASDEDAPATHLFAGNFGGQVAARDAAVAERADSTRETDTEIHNSNVYETDDSLHMYLDLHYPSSGITEGVSPILPHNQSPVHGTHFPQRVANMLTSLNPKRTTNKVLDMGCSVGGSSFELAKTFDSVDAFDFSENFINAAKGMQTGEKMVFKVPIEAELFETVNAALEPGVTPEIASKVNFFVGDACKIEELPPVKGDGGNYDGVVMSNLLCRLPDPIACLNGLKDIVNPEGIVVMVTPFSWLTEFTPRGKWLGGFLDPVTNEEIRSKDVLQSIMEGNGFSKIHEEQMPLVIREHARKYQYIVSEATAWKKN